MTVRPEVVKVLTGLIPGQPHPLLTAEQEAALMSATPEEKAEAARRYLEEALSSADPVSALLPVIASEIGALFEQFAAEEAGT